MSKKKNVSDYFVYGFVIDCMDIDFPAFQFSSRSLKKVCDFVSSIDFKLIKIQVVRYFEDGTTNFINVDLLKELSNEV